MGQGIIILLNGVSSAGKSSLSKELTKLLPDYFHLSLDDYDTIIERMEDRAAGRLIPVATERYFHRTVAMFADSGVNLIVDHILHDDATLQDALRTLSGSRILFVGVHCGMEELRRREAARGDRRIGQAEGQLAYVHQQQEQYDIEVDTSESTISACAARIAEAVRSEGDWTGWQSTVEARR